MEIGLDIVEVHRIRRIIRRTPGFLDRVFTKEEISYCRGHKDPWPHYAARFAANAAKIRFRRTAIVCTQPRITARSAPASRMCC